MAYRPGHLPDIAFGSVNIATVQETVPYAAEPGNHGEGVGGRTSDAIRGVIANHTKAVTLNIASARSNTAENAAVGTNPHGGIVNFAYTFHLKGGNKASTGTQNKNLAMGAGGGQ